LPTAHDRLDEFLRDTGGDVRAEWSSEFDFKIRSDSMQLLRHLLIGHANEEERQISSRCDAALYEL
jgi:hypothetical protein